VVTLPGSPGWHGSAAAVPWPAPTGLSRFVPTTESRRRVTGIGERRAAEAYTPLPPFFCPFPPATRSDTEDIEARCLRWTTEFGSHGSPSHFAWIAASKPALSICMALPNGIPERVELVGRFMYWAFSFDDHHFEEGPYGAKPDQALPLVYRLQRTVEAPTSQMFHGNPWAAALADMRISYDRFATPEQRARWVEAWRLLFQGWAWETVYRSQLCRLELNDYLVMRMWNIGMSVLTEMNDVTDGYVLPATARYHPTVRALTELLWTIVGLDNDVYSYAKENLRHRNSLNIIDLLARDRGSSAADALTEAIAIRDRMMCLFLALREQERPGASTELRSYMDSLGQWVRTNIDWGTMSARYLSPAGVNDPAGDTSATVPLAEYTETPTDDSLEPLPISSIRWWWDQLR
jgi:hypothetical protein